MVRVTIEQAYPGISFRPRTHNWWARLTRVPAECAHLDGGPGWMAALVPDTLYLRGKSATRRDPARPEVSLCRDCLVGVLAAELAAYRGRVVAFEPDPEAFSQYFFVAAPDFDAAGLAPEVAAAVGRRLEQSGGSCAACSRPASWLWLSREQVASLDDFGSIGAAPGERLCAEHGANRLCRAFEKIAEANLLYMNLPYGDAGAYVWI